MHKSHQQSLNHALNMLNWLVLHVLAILKLWHHFKVGVKLYTVN